MITDQQIDTNQQYRSTVSTIVVVVVVVVVVATTTIAATNSYNQRRVTAYNKRLQQTQKTCGNKPRHGTRVVWITGQ